jgi:hypothetical protein
MKIIFSLFLISAFSVSAFAEQKINCRQINKNGTVKTNGIGLSLSMASAKSGAAKVTGIKDSRLSELVVHSTTEGKRNGFEYTTIFLTPKEDDGMLDIQLQFDTLVLGRNFSHVKATYVVGSDDANPETGFSIGFDMTCNSRVH